MVDDQSTLKRFHFFSELIWNDLPCLASFQGQATTPGPVYFYAYLVVKSSLLKIPDRCSKNISLISGEI